MDAGTVSERHGNEPEPSHKLDFIIEEPFSYIFTEKVSPPMILRQPLPISFA